MREIKFRGKRLDNNEWVYGYLADETYINDINTFDLSSIEVDSDTVGQYTGLNDKNSREIYEHDLIECGGILCEVVFNSHIGSFSLLEVFTQQLGSQTLGVMLDMFHSSLKGNIHDNPELLEGGEQ